MITPLNILAAGDPMDHVLPHTIFTVGGLPFTNHMLMLLIAAVLMMILFPLAARNYPLVPTGARALFETALDFVRTGIAQPLLKEHTDRMMPFIWTLFFFILVNNLLGLIPLDALLLVTTGKSHVFGAATAGLSVTAALAAITFVMTHVLGIREQYHHQRHHGRSPVAAFAVGFVHYFRSLVPSIPGLAGIILFPLLLVLELLGALVKPFALAIRLFANIMGGHTVLACLVMLIPAAQHWTDAVIAAPTLLGCVALSCLEVFVAFLQTYIFVFLSCLFIGAAIHPEH